MDAKYYMGDDERDSLRPAGRATIAPSCRSCGYVVYKVAVRLATGGVLCQSCAEAQKVDAA